MNGGSPIRHGLNRGLNWLRSLLYTTGSVLVLMVIALSAPFTLLLPQRLRARWLSLWATFNIVWLRLICGVAYTVRGLDQCPSGPVVYLLKHQSTWETMALQSLRPEIGWVLKKQLLRVPFFGWGIAMTRPVAIDRGSPRAAVEQVLRDGKRLLESGRSMAIFPEGTRVSPGSRGRYNRSGAALAKAAGVPIIPVAHNAGEFWPRRRFSKTPGEIKLIFGPAIDSSTMSAAELTQTAESWIEQEVARISGRPLALPENH